MGSNPSTVYWMDIFSHISVVQIETLDEKNEKEAGMALLKNIFDLVSKITSNRSDNSRDKATEASKANIVCVTEGIEPKG